MWYPENYQIYCMSGLTPGKTRGSGSLLKRLRAAEQLGSVNIIKAPQKRWMTAVIEQIFAANMATGSFPAWRHLAYPRGTPEKLYEKVGSWRLCYLRSLSRNLFMEHFGLLSFLRPAKTWGAVDWRDPAPVKVGIVYPHHLYWVSYILSVISLLTHQHQQYHQVPRLEPTVIKAAIKADDFHNPSRWSIVRWWLGHPIGKNMSWIWKCYPHCFPGSDWKNVWNHLACIQYQGYLLCLQTLRLPQHLRKLDASRIAEVSTRLHSCVETKSLKQPPHVRSNGERSKMLPKCQNILILQ